MTDVASRELRNQTRALLDRVAAGERITITVDGRAVAELGPITDRPVWMSRRRFVEEILANQADAQLSDEIRSLAPDTLDDLPLP